MPDRKMINFRRPLYKFHSDETKRIFYKNIKNYVGHLDHMCMTVALPDGTLMMQSPIPAVEDHYYATKEARMDKGLSAEFYKNFSYYCWKDAVANPNVRKTILDNDLRESLYSLYNGYFIVRKLEDIHIIWGIASHCKDPRIATVFFNNINKIVEACDFYYDSLWYRFNEHINFELPKITKFSPLIDELDLKRLQDKEEKRASNLKSGITFPSQRPFLRVVK